MLTKINTNIECVTHTHTHTHVESRNSLGLVGIPKNDIMKEYIKLVMY